MEIYISCPHCNALVLIYKNEINCAIFRHGVVKSTMQQIDPHLSKFECDRLTEEGLIIGCGKPFRLIMNKEEEYFAIKCDYI